jgi:hypothetical protein
MGCKASKPKRSFSKFLAADAAPLAERNCCKTCVFPTEPARSAALREAAVRRQGSGDSCSVMKARYHALYFSERRIDAFIFEGLRRDYVDATVFTLLSLPWISRESHRYL